MTPGEVMQLPSEQELILLSGKRPIKAEKIRYYEDLNFTERRLDPSQTTGSSPETPPSRWSGRRASIHTELILQHQKYKEELAARKAGGKTNRPSRKPEIQTDIEDTLEAEKAEKDVDKLTQQELDDIQDAVFKFFGIDDANDVGGMLGHDPSDDDDDGGIER